MLYIENTLKTYRTTCLLAMSVPAPIRAGMKRKDNMNPTKRSQLLQMGSTALAAGGGVRNTPKKHGGFMKRASAFVVLFGTAALLSAQSAKPEQQSQQEQLAQLLVQMQKAGTLPAPPSSGPTTLSPAQFQQIMQGLGSGGQMDPTVLAQLTKMMAAQSGASTVPAAPADNRPQAAQKRPGMIRVCILAPTVQFDGLADPTASQHLVGEVLSMVISYLQAPTVETISLRARVPAAASAEAKASDCDHILTLSLVRKSTKSSKAGILSMSRHLPIGMIPGIGAIAQSTGGVIAAQAATVAAGAAASISSNIQPKDTVMFEYSLTGVKSGSVVVGNKVAVTAKSAGEDLITPMMSSMATAMMSELLKEPKP